LCLRAFVVNLLLFAVNAYLEGAFLLAFPDV